MFYARRWSVEFLPPEDKDRSQECDLYTFYLLYLTDEIMMVLVYFTTK